MKTNYVEWLTKRGSLPQFKTVFWAPKVGSVLPRRIEISTWNIKPKELTERFSVLLDDGVLASLTHTEIKSYMSEINNHT